MPSPQRFGLTVGELAVYGAAGRLAASGQRDAGLALMAAIWPELPALVAAVEANPAAASDLPDDSQHLVLPFVAAHLYEAIAAVDRRGATLGAIAHCRAQARSEKDLALRDSAGNLDALDFSIAAIIDDQGDNALDAIHDHLTRVLSQLTADVDSAALAVLLDAVAKLWTNAYGIGSDAQSTAAFISRNAPGWLQLQFLAGRSHWDVPACLLFDQLVSEQRFEGKTHVGFEKLWRRLHSNAITIDPEVVSTYASWRNDIQSWWARSVLDVFTGRVPDLARLNSVAWGEHVASVVSLAGRTNLRDAVLDQHESLPYENIHTFDAMRIVVECEPDPAVRHHIFRHITRDNDVDTWMLVAGARDVVEWATAMGHLLDPDTGIDAYAGLWTPHPSRARRRALTALITYTPGYAYHLYHSLDADSVAAVGRAAAVLLGPTVVDAWPVAIDLLDTETSLAEACKAARQVIAPKPKS